VSPARTALLAALSALLSNPACTRARPEQAWPASPGFEGCRISALDPRALAPRRWRACAGAAPEGCLELDLNGRLGAFARSSPNGPLLLVRSEDAGRFVLTVGPLEGPPTVALAGPTRSPCALVEADAGEGGIALAVSRPVGAGGIEVAYELLPPGATELGGRPSILAPGAFGGALFAGAIPVGPAVPGGAGRIVSTGGGRLIATSGTGFVELVNAKALGGPICCTAAVGGRILFHTDGDPPRAWLAGPTGEPRLLHQPGDGARSTPLLVAGAELIWFEAREPLGGGRYGRVDLFRAPIPKEGEAIDPRPIGPAGVDRLPVDTTAGPGLVAFGAGRGRLRWIRLADGGAGEVDAERAVYASAEGLIVSIRGAVQRWPIAPAAVGR
jgi:hypothetical protein